MNASESPARAPPAQSAGHFTRHGPWPTLCAALALASCLFWRFDLADTLAWRPASWQQGLWSLWSLPLANDTGVDVLIACGSLVVLAILGSYLGADRSTVMAVLLAWPVSTAGQMAWPEVPPQGGATALLYAMFSALCIHALRQRATRIAGVVLLGMLAVKLMLDQAWSRPVGFDPNWGTNLVYAAHLCGALAGTGSALVIRRP